MSRPEKDDGGGSGVRFWLTTIISVVGVIGGILAWDDFKPERHRLLCQVRPAKCDAPAPPQPGPVEPWRLRPIPDDVLRRIGRPGTPIEESEQVLGDRPVFIGPEHSYRIYEGGNYRVVLSDFSEGGSGHTVYHSIRLALAAPPSPPPDEGIPAPWGSITGKRLGTATFGDVHRQLGCRRVTLWNNDGRAACSNKIELECGPVADEPPAYIRPGILVDCPSYHEESATVVNPTAYEIYPLVAALGNPGRSAESSAVQEEVDKFVTSPEVSDAVFNYLIISDHPWSPAEDDDE